MRTRTIVTVALLLGAWAPASARAQEAAPNLHAGSRVRVTAPARSLMGLRATVVEATPAGMRIRTEDGLDTLSLPYASISRLEVPHRHGNAAAGAALGGLLGLAFGLAAGASSAGDWICCNAGQTAVLGLVMGAAGAGLGAGLGALTHSEGWRDVRVPESNASPPTRSRGGPLVSVGSGIRIGWSLALR